MPWKVFLVYNLAASAVCGTSCILIGYFLGTMWMLFEAWLGPTLPYLILAGVALIILGVIFRHSLLEILAPRFTKRRQSL
jgi:membrane protein DedA with SNARE-associated domain